MTINEYIGRIAKTYIDYYGALVNAASYFGEVIEDTFDYIEEFCCGEWMGSFYVISVKTDDGVKNIAINEHWYDYDIKGVETLKVYEDYEEDGYHHANHRIDREGNLYKWNEDRYGYEKVER